MTIKINKEALKEAVAKSIVLSARKSSIDIDDAEELISAYIQSAIENGGGVDDTPSERLRVAIASISQLKFSDDDSSTDLQYAYNMLGSLLNKLEGGEAKAEISSDDLANVANMLVGVCYEAAHTAGWWRDAKTGLDVREWPEHIFKLWVGTKLALVHSEVSEGLEGYRKGLMDDKLPHRQMLEVELADAVIRIFDLAGGLDFDLGGAIAEKLSYNAQRADHRPESREAAGGKSF